MKNLFFKQYQTANTIAEFKFFNNMWKVSNLYQIRGHDARTEQ